MSKNGKSQDKKTQTKSKPGKILVTSALPYANGPIHLGHLVEYIQTDIWVRVQKFLGNEVYYFCADDTHGTPIMIAARKQGITPDALVERTHEEHYRDLTAFDVKFDNYYSTNSSENKELSEYIYNKSKEKGYIDRKTVSQLFCNHDNMFLPDRFVRGTCPSCGASDQYGDSCEVCGATYAPESMADARCSICGTPPVKKDSEHLFFKLSAFQDYLRQWLDSHDRVDEGVRKKMGEWVDAGLREWDISRDGPYFGFPIPGETNKYFYVWLDAPIGYLASAKNFFNEQGKPELFDNFWKADSEDEVYHFIGKDIIYFHTLFWPALLHAADFRTPTAVRVHGFLTFNGEKMSKSRGTLIRASTFLKHMKPDPLRYYYASRLGSGLDDLDLSGEDFVSRYNGDVVGNLTNIFSRLCSGIAKKLDYRLSATLSPEGHELKKNALNAADRIIHSFQDRAYAKAIREINALGDEINRLINDRAPWQQIKEDPEKARQTITDALTSGKILAGLLKPVLPQFTAGVESLLNLKQSIDYDNLDREFDSGHTINPYEHLTGRIEVKAIEAMIEEERKAVEKAKVEEEKAKAAESKTGDAGARESAKESKEESGIITIDDLAKVELKVGKILEADIVEGADRLLKISLDVGEEKPRQVIAGIRVAYKPDELVGLSVVCVANLKPRKMKFGMSEAMLLAAGEGENLTLFIPQKGAKPGDRLR